MPTTYFVSLPISGVLHVSVEAAAGLSDEEVIDLALDSEYTIDNLESWSAHPYLVRGNVFAGELAEACVDYFETDEEPADEA